MGMLRWGAHLLLLLLLAAATWTCAGAGVTSEYRRKLEATVDMPLDADVFRVPPGYNAPQQVHITLGDQTGTAMTVSWVTANELGSSTVRYGSSPEKLDRAAEGSHTRYDYFNYTSGFIHHCTLTGLTHATKYYYAMGFDHTVRTFSFTTPPKPAPDAPFNTLAHYEANGGDAVLFVGDLSYADNYPLHDNNRWDTWARFVERSVAYQPWIWTAGNHELDYAPELGETVPFKPFTHRYPTPYRAAGSTEPFWYSVKIASAHVIVLASYSAYGKYTPQWTWLQEELATRVDRKLTPWLIVLMHSPWYNSNNYHYMEGETMRVQFERWLVDAKVDVVLAGHVHSYERSRRFANIEYNIVNGKATPAANVDAPVYITIGDGGNIEGIANNFTVPQPAYSAFREASFGHATLEIKNRTHAHYAWHRNHDGAKAVADAVWLTNRYWMPINDDIRSSMAMEAACVLAVVVVVLAFLSPAARGGVTSTYRRSLQALPDMPIDADVFRPPPGFNAPEQVHITLGDQTGRAMTVSWVTPKLPDSNVVRYGLRADNLTHTANGTFRRYSFGRKYRSGFIHHATLTGLDYGTKYHYAVGSGDTASARSFSFTTPPKPGPDVPYKFGLIGDLGQTFHSNDTLSHYEACGGDAVLFIGDLSYADNHPGHDNNRWDTWARFVERSVAYQPWIWTTGNHELDFAPELGETTPFKPFTNRYPTPFGASGSTRPLWYSVRMASAHVIVLASYAAYGKYTPQWRWLEGELRRVDRAVTPWLIVCVHSPWYSSNGYHYMEGESMRVEFERWLVDAKADVVLAGHVHSYERTRRVSNVAYDIANGMATPVFNRSAPVYINIGDGGNIEGLADDFRWPQPDYSVFREASFGHATLQIVNRTHAFYEWHRNSDGVKVVADHAWFTNRYWTEKIPA
uniref:Purple acid phosphatase n=1 Tax=Oryza glumipatula TaxID=40148 RepID=A0A0E0BVP6_9ORYZ